MVDRHSIHRSALGLVSLLVALAVAVACGSSTSVPAGAAAPDRPHRIFVVHSYSDTFAWTRQLHEGISEGLARNGLLGGRDYQVQTFYMDTRINFTSPQQIEERAAQALEALRAFEPDLLFVTDDVALEHVAVKIRRRRAPTCSASHGIRRHQCGPDNLRPDRQSRRAWWNHHRRPGAHPAHRGLCNCAKRLFPDVTRVVILADAGAGSESVRAAFQRDDQAADARPFEVLDFLLLETFEQWKRAVVNYQDKADLIAVVNFHQLRDASGEIVPPAEVIDWMVAENNLPELGLVADWAREGILVAVGNSGLKTGAYVGALGADILNGADPATVPIVDPKQTDTSFNLARARSLGIEFPADELAAADNVFETIGGQ